MRRLMAIGLGLAGLWACTAALTPAQVAEVAGIQAQIDKCKAEGKEAGSYKAYDDCMRDAGLHE